MCALRYAFYATPSIPTAVADLPPNLPLRGVVADHLHRVHGERDASPGQQSDPAARLWMLMVCRVGTGGGRGMPT
jgi:hypothetical protein